MLGTRTFREGGVMIRWLGPLGCMWAPAIMPLHYLYWMWSCLGFLYFNTLICGLIVRIIICFICVVVMRTL